MSHTGFDTSWLNLRFQYDNAARNQKVEQTFLDYFRGKKKITIVDIGSGTGANCLYFFEKLEQDQQWFLIEKDDHLLESTFIRLSAYAESKGYSFQIEKKSLRINIRSKKINIHIINDSFFKLSQMVDLIKVDVVMAAAVFDLLSKDQFITIADKIFLHKIDLLTTMNYSNMHFLPGRDLDDKFIDLYESHMSRPQQFGKGMGKSCSFFMETYFSDKKYHFIKGNSSWKIDCEAFEMHNFLLGFMGKSIGELTKKSADKKLLDQWFSEKKSLSQKQLLSIEVGHLDYFVTI